MAGAMSGLGAVSLMGQAPEGREGSLRYNHGVIAHVRIIGGLMIAMAALNLALGLTFAGLLGVAHYSLAHTPDAPESSRVFYRVWAIPWAVLAAYLIIP